MNPHATILAIASPPGRSLRGIIRISGAAAFALVHPHLACGAQPIRGARSTELSLPKLGRFSAIALFLPAPHSYTGEDSVELQLPGNPTLLARALEALVESGAERRLDVRRAEPGEYTARAFLNGRMDLTQAEGVASTIAAQSDGELTAARLLVSGRLGDMARGMADDLAAALALVEAGIDFTDQDDVVAIDPGDLHDRLDSLRQRLHGQLVRSAGIEQLRAIPWVVIVGPPNAGKSALFNALLGHERAVVSGMAGTTRDVLAEPLHMNTAHGAAEIMLVDIAGFDADDQSSMNALMQATGRSAVARAELILRCIPADEASEDVSVRAMASTEHEIVVRTKSDLLAPGVASGLAKGTFAVSAHSGAGLTDLRRAIAQRLSHRAVSLAAGALALQPRHEAAMRSALANVERTIALVSPHRHSRAVPNPELIASSMRAALDDLASLAGVMTPDDILGRIFASFCIGK